MPAHTPVPSARRLGLSLATVLALALAGCAAPSTNNGSDAPTDAVADTRSTGASAGAPAESGTAASAPVQLPPATRPSPRPSLGPGPGDGNAAGAAVVIDRSCSSDAQCTVKDVGNCCGYYPACVNVDSPTDPEGVKAQCAKSGMASVCGFPAITSCQCVAGECKGSSQALLE